MKNHLKISIKRHKEDFLKKLDNWEQQILAMCDKITHENLYNLAGANLAKKFFKIDFDQLSKGLVFDAKLRYQDQENMELNLKSFDENIEKAFNQCYLEIERLRITPMMMVEDWFKTSSFKINPLGMSLVFERKDGIGNNHQNTVYKLPLRKRSKFKLKHINLNNFYILL